MARVTVDPGSLKRKTLPDGTYPVEIRKCEVQAQKNNPNAHKVYWEFQVTPDCPDPEAVGAMLFAHTSIEPGKGDTYLRFTQSLGFNPAEFDTEAAQGLKCYARVKTRISRNSITGENESANDVADLLKGDE